MENDMRTPDRTGRGHLRLWLALVVSVGIFADGRSLHARRQSTGYYNLVDLGTLGGESGSFIWSSVPWRVGETGIVIGQALTAGGTLYHPFVYRAGVMYDLAPLSSNTLFWSALGVNASDKVVGGVFDTTTSTFGGFLYDGTQLIDLTPFGIVNYALDINDQGDIVGVGASGHAVLLHNGQLSDLGTLGGNYSDTYGLNNAGQIIGTSDTGNGETHGFVYQNGEMTDLGTLGGTYVQPEAINESGQIVGISYTANGPLRAFIYENAVMSDLGAGDGSFAYDISNSGVVVGDGGGHAFKWSNGVLTDLNMLVDPASGWFLESAYGINSAGQIAVLGTKNGIHHALLLTPPGATVAGAAVTVSSTPELPGGGTANVAVTFNTVLTGGETTVTASNSGPAAPSGFKLPDPPLYFDVQTTSTFTGTVSVCFSWQEGQFNNEGGIRLFHYENSAWHDVTTSMNTTANTICGQTSSLSPFTLAEISYTFTGFFQPVDNVPVQNSVKAGAAVPVKFSLGGPQGLAIFAPGFPRTQQVQCQTGDLVDAIEETVTAGGSGLTYDAGSGRYTYVWKTDKAWSGGCRELQLTLADGQTYRARFKFLK
jgi:probable HAF family extracellular repeat protein